MKEKKYFKKICYSIINYLSLSKRTFNTNYYELQNNFFLKKNYIFFSSFENSYKHNITKIENEKKNIKKKESVNSDITNLKKFELIVDNNVGNENRNIFKEEKENTTNSEQYIKKELCEEKKILEINSSCNNVNIEEINSQTHHKIRTSKNFKEKINKEKKKKAINRNIEKKFSKCKSYIDKEKFNMLKKEDKKNEKIKKKCERKCDKNVEEIKEKDTKIVKKKKTKNKELINSSTDENNKTNENGNNKKNKKKSHAIEIPISTNFNQKEYFKEFEQLGLKNNVIINHLKKVEDISIFVNNNISMSFENIYAYNNFLYEIYDKFSNSEIKKIKKLIKNYNKLTKKNLKKKIKYFEAFYELCPKEYSEVLTCLFIQSVDILKPEDVSNTFYYDQILNNNKENENNSILEAFESSQGSEKNTDNVQKKGTTNAHVNYIKNQCNLINKSVYEIDVHFEKNNANSFNENKFIIVYNLPIISFDLLVEELKGTFSFCGKIKNIEFFSERLKTVDINLLNNELISENNKKKSDNNNNNNNNNKNLKNALNPNNYTQLYGIIEFENEKSAILATNDFIRIFGIFCYNKLIYVDKCVNKKIMVITHLPFHLSVHNILHLLLNASLYSIDVFNSNRDFENKNKSEKLHLNVEKIEKFLQGDKTSKENTDNESAAEKIIEVKENTYETSNRNLNQSFEEEINDNITKKVNENRDINKCTFVLKNSDIKIENTNSFFSHTYTSSSDIYNYIYEISKKNFKKLEEKNKSELETKIDDDDDINNDNKNKENNFESFVDFYQNKNKKVKTKKVDINNNGRTLILHFDNFKNLFECLKKFKYIFKNKNYMIFSLNLRRCVYMNGAIKDHIYIKNSENKFNLKIKE